MPKAYSKEVRNQADTLLKQGLSMPKVAEMLGLSRPETIAVWKKKYGIGKKKKDKSLPSIPPTERLSAQSHDLLEKSLNVWKEVQDISLRKLKEIDFRSAEGTVQALEVAEKCIVQLACMIENIKNMDAQSEQEKAGGNQGNPPEGMSSDRSPILKILGATKNKDEKDREIPLQAVKGPDLSAEGPEKDRDSKE